MKKKDLLKLLEDIPDDATICVPDSYGAFSYYNHFSGDFVKTKVLINGEPSWYYVLDTDRDEDGFSEFRDNLGSCEIVRPTLPEKATKLLSELFPNSKHYYHTADTKLSMWEPKITGGNEQDKLEIKQASDAYWRKLEAVTGFDEDELKNMTLGDLK